MANGFGVDIGGSGIKAAVVDLDSGTFVGERQRVDTPEGGKPDDVAGVVRRLVESCGWDGPFGVGFPAVVSRGVAKTAANVSKKWIDTDAAALFAGVTGRERDTVVVANDADVAGLAEVHYGDEELRRGVTVFLTLGTGVGSAVFNDGVLLPNTEFGHLEIRGKDAEERASSSAKERHGWSWKKWAEHLSELLDHVDRLLIPDRYVLGGGVSTRSDEFVPLLGRPGRVSAATLHNRAGIIGAALMAAKDSKRDS